MITLLVGLLGTKPAAAVLLSGAEASGGGFSTGKSLTPIGWLIVCVFSLALILGIIFIVAGLLKKRN